MEKCLILVLLLVTLVLIVPSFAASCDNDPQKLACAMSFLSPGLPRMYSVKPSQAYRGETIDITIKGDNFTGGEPKNHSGKITFNDYTVHDDTQITANITIAADAAIGPTRVEVHNEKGTGNFLEFNILQPETD